MILTIFDTTSHPFKIVQNILFLRKYSELFPPARALTICLSVLSTRTIFFSNNGYIGGKNICRNHDATAFSVSPYSPISYSIGLFPWECIGFYKYELFCIDKPLLILCHSHFL